MNLNANHKTFADELLKLYTPMEIELILRIARLKIAVPKLSEKTIFNKIKKEYPAYLINSTLQKLQVNKLIEDYKTQKK